MEFINKKYVELINKEIDHIISPDEKKRLDNYLSDNKHAQVYYNGLLKINGYLNQLPDREPSENLKKQIINSIDFGRYAPKTKKQNPRGFMFAPKFKLAYTFAAGLILGIIIYALVTSNQNTVNINDVYGTIGINNSSATTVADIPLDFSNITGKIVIKGLDRNFWFNLDLNSTNKFDIVISYPEQVKFENIRLGLAKNIEISKGQNLIKTRISGSQKYSLLFSQDSQEPSNVKIEIVQDGKTLYERTLSINE